MLPFDPPILLRGLRTASLMNDAMRQIEIGHEELSPIVTPYNFYFGIKLCFNKFDKAPNTIMYFRF